jgi:hypothetical protein
VRERFSPALPSARRDAPCPRRAPPYINDPSKLARYVHEGVPSRFNEHDRRGEESARLSRDGKLELTEETRLPTVTERIPEGFRSARPARIAPRGP